MKNKHKKNKMKKLILSAMAGFLALNVNAQSWSVTGNAGTDASVNFIGTTDQTPFRIRTNNANRVTFSASGNVGIGTTNPAVKLDVKGPGLWDLSSSEGDFRI